jgi:hypothetical protein
MTVTAARVHLKLPRTAEVYFIGPEASVQFADNPFNFRVCHVHGFDRFSPAMDRRLPTQRQRHRKRVSVNLRHARRFTAGNRDQATPP